MTEPAPFTVLSVLKAAEGYLKGRSVDAPRLCAERLLAKVLRTTRLHLYLLHDRPLDDEERARMREFTGRRGRHEPLAYLLGEAEFYGLALDVDPAVLIPRPETEGLVELVLECAPPAARIVELGTGSGAIAIALASKRPDLQIVATDASAAALEVAARNLKRHDLGARVRLMHGSWWEPLAQEPPFDLLVSNPPYVDPARDDLVAYDVKTFEPHEALFTRPHDPASCYRAIFAGMSAHLRASAMLLFETGIEAAEPAFAALSATPGVGAAELRRDLADLPRYLVARWGGS